jgi:hypothetical protein
MLKILALFKKLKAKRKKKKEGEKGAPPTPGVNKIAVFGHTNVGKTVFFVMAHEASRADVRFRLDTRDDLTAAELLSNLKMLRGLEASVVEGARTEKRVERRFPPPTSETKALSFVAVLKQRKRFDFTSLDYRGEIASIDEQPELKEDLINFCVESDCILFFIEPEVIFSELYCKNQLASFQSLLQRVVDGGGSLSMPVGLVVSKADLLEGFEDEGHAVLISRRYEYAKSKRYDQFVERLLDQPHIRMNERWRTDLRRVLEHLEDFFKTLSGMSLDYQVFFVSAIGSKPPQKLDERGAAINVPPRHMKPIGIKEPFKWAVTRALVQRRIRAWRKATRLVFWLAFLWCLLFSIPNLLNIGFWYPDILSVEEEITGSGYRHDLSKLNDGDLRDFEKRYRKYAGKIFVSAFFGMGQLKEFARTRFREIDARIPEKKAPPPPDTLFQKDQETYEGLVNEFAELRGKTRKGDHNFRLGEAPLSLQDLKSRLDPGQFLSNAAKAGAKSMIDQIDKYLDGLECWDQQKTFQVVVAGIPAEYELEVRIADRRYGRFFHDDPGPLEVTWQKGEPVVYILQNRRGGKPLSRSPLGSYAVVDSAIEFSEVPCVLEVSKKGFDCKLPSL